uniref:Uncharacterized protein n=1 Tax=Aureoumbra lagunensis TaxID=44058 RepID=A0A7S3JXY8_9STRA|mmetsp:Transcript_12844/g.19254  ORF Transcript_12844/g.19254 Transcript_12844/m.19254 type:complete len:300 (+) Transcript_12844:60-959(+)
MNLSDDNEEVEWCGFSEVYSRRKRRRLTYSDRMNLYVRPSQNRTSRPRSRPRLSSRKNMNWPSHVERFAAEVGVTWIVSVCGGNAPHRLSVCRALSKALRTPPEDVINQCPWLLCPPRQWQPARSVTRLAPDPLLTREEIDAGLTDSDSNRGYHPPPDIPFDHGQRLQPVQEEPISTTEKEEEKKRKKDDEEEIIQDPGLLRTEIPQIKEKIPEHEVPVSQLKNLVDCSEEEGEQDDQEALLRSKSLVLQLADHSLLDAVRIAAPSTICLNDNFDDRDDGDLSNTQALDALIDLLAEIT